MKATKLTMLLMSMVLLVAPAVCGMSSVSAAEQATVKISGIVTDNSGNPVPGAAVILKGSTTGVNTDLDGRFTISVPAGATLTVTCIGYADIDVAAKDGMKVVLSEDNLFLDEVVVIGYGEQKKELMTSSVVSVTTKDLQKAPQTNVSNMLTGKLAGVTAVQSTGTPGADAADITIRGLSTYGSNNRPLYIIDGMESGSMNFLNPNDIESISVLKDAAAAAVYGVRGGNGVIIITTKSGSKSGHATVSYDGSFTVTRNVNEAELLTGTDDPNDKAGYIYWYNKALANDGLAPKWTPEVIEQMKKDGVYANTNWRDEIYNKVGILQQHNVSVNGGTDKVTYFGSVGYMDQIGTVKNTGYNRFNVRANVNAQIVEGLSFNANLSLRRSKRYSAGFDDATMGNQGYFNPIQRANYMLPILASTYTDDNGRVWPLGMLNNGAVLSPNNEVANSGSHTWETWEWQARGNLEYVFPERTFLRGLRLSFFGGVNYNMDSEHQFLQKTTVYGFDRNTFKIAQYTSEGIEMHSFNKHTNWSNSVTLRPQINYDRTFGKHNVTVLALFERTKYYEDLLGAWRKKYAAANPVDIDLGTEQSNPYQSGSHKTTGNAGFVVRLGYNYAEKYLVELSAREEASYVFPPEGRWGFFPSLSLGWIMSKENFMRNVTWIDNLKLRASVGQLGSSDVAPYLYLSTFENSKSVTWALGGQPVYGFYTTNPYVYSDLTWSHTTAYNFGFDLTVLKHKLTIGFDWFYKYTDRILEQSGGNNYSPSLGGENPTWQNTGSMDDRGFELIIRHDNWLPSGFNYSITGNLSWSRNKVLSRYISDQYSLENIEIGRPLGQWYGFKTNGLFMTQEEVDAAPTPPSGTVEIGAFRYVDTNGDGKITRDNRDYVWLGYSKLPEMNASLNIEMSYKGFALSALFYGVTLTNFIICGNYDKNGVAFGGSSDNTMFTRPWYGAGGNAFRYLVEQSFDPANPDPNAYYPRLRSSYNPNNAVLCDRWVIDGSYIRLKNLQLSYTIPERITRKAKMSRVMVYLAGTNLFTLSHFPYLDPENPGLTNGYYPQQRTYSVGLNVTF
ncbi:MAG: TonB-dependent receptor [Bacteroidales bacterium]|nr:TonB-dependent receptor [Bacteroidales bacterium]